MRILVMLLVGVVLSLMGCARTDCYYVTGGQLVARPQNTGSGAPEPPRLLLEGHGITAGAHLVLLVRKWDPGQYFAPDAGLFEKLTVEIKQYTVGTPIPLNSTAVRFYYSHGGSAWIRQGAGVYGSEGTGKLLIHEHRNKRMRITVDVALLAKPAGLFQSEEIVHVRGEYVFRELPVDRLTPWLGLPVSANGNAASPAKGMSGWLQWLLGF